METTKFLSSSSSESSTVSRQMVAVPVASVEWSDGVEIEPSELNIGGGGGGGGDAGLAK